ncbi:MAG: serine hydrolase domain-containing protein [Planctomycetota bacterium]|jgi:CubicO group peptidase (beta-lactamase class C family)
MLRNAVFGKSRGTENLAMKPLAKRCLIVLCVVLIVLGLTGCAFFAKPLNAAYVGAAYKAKVLASGVFVSQRDPQDVLREDLSHIAQLKWFTHKIDRENGSVKVSLFGLIRRKAIFRKGLGCTVIADDLEAKVRAQRYSIPEPEPRNPDKIPWPMGDLILNDKRSIGFDLKKVSKVVEEAFIEPDPSRLRRTRAVVVAYDGQIIAERYALGITHTTALGGWSMTKSVLNALVGILAGQGKLSVQEPAPVPQWQQPGDPRTTITLDQLLRMTSGLAFGEYYRRFPSDVNLTLFVDPDTAAFAADKPLIAQPGTRWAYSSGSANIVSGIIRQALGGDQTEYFAFPRRALFNKIGMRSAVLEPDTAGNFVASSFMYATARDWARFGLLYLQDGVWEGQRILPEGWVEYTRSPTPAAPEYGALFWLNTADASGKRVYSDLLPSDMFMARGYEKQVIAIIPSRKLVVVRLGMTHEGEWGFQQFMADLLKAIPQNGLSDAKCRSSVEMRQI